LFAVSADQSIAAAPTQDAPACASAVLPARGSSPNLPRTGFPLDDVLDAAWLLLALGLVALLTARARRVP